MNVSRPDREKRTRKPQIADATKTMPEWEKQELVLLLADWAQRQDEIAIRSRAENYNFVLVVTSLATIGGLFIAFRDEWDMVSESLPLITAIGAFLLSILPVNLAHVATSTELRRHYLETRVEPRIIDLMKRQGQPEREYPLLTFEQFDRSEHRGIYNTLIFGRAIFSLAPSTVLAILCVIATGNQILSPTASGLAVPDVIVNFFLVLLAIAFTVLSILALSSMWRRTLILRARHEAHEDSPYLTGPRRLLKERRRSARSERGSVSG